jgi:hypothetical protein
MTNKTPSSSKDGLLQEEVKHALNTLIFLVVKNE